MKRILTLGALVFLAVMSPTWAADQRPNILWFVVDDMSANLSCYGEKTIQTPNIDRLAREGTRFAKAFTTAPVCSPCRSAFITGMYQTTIGSHQHRSGRGEEKIVLPDGIVPVPAQFQKAGYYTCIGSGLPNVRREKANGKANAKKKEKAGGDDEGGAAGLGKTDYNFEWDRGIYNSPDWAGRKPGQPFFMQVQMAGGKLRGGNDEGAKKLMERAKTEFGAATDPEKVTLPPYYPRDAVELRDWAAYLDAVRFTDKHVGQVIERLEKEGILEQTIIVFVTDHGISHARGKQFLYDEGTHVPFIVRGPGVEKGKVRNDLIELIDIAATSLAAAKLPVPSYMQAKNVLAKDYQPRAAVYAARDRCDETVERIRSVRTDKYLYIRNFYPQRPHLQPNAYKDGKSIVQTLRTLQKAGQLDPLQEKLLFSPTRPAEELYEWTTDRYQVKNLAGDAAAKATLEKMRADLDRWIVETKDKGPESEKMYDSDMAVYVGGRGKKETGTTVTERNIAQMKAWAKEGK
ncbi:MAG: sulfatase [Verrucomicrobiota bacterium]